METILLLSLPGTSEYTAYRESTSGEQRFSFHPFNHQNHPAIDIRVEQCPVPEHITPPDDEFHAYQLYREDYLKLIADTRMTIQNNDWGKIVMSRAQKHSYKCDDFLPVYRKICDRYPGVCVYLFCHPDCGLWIGATPELLLSGNGNSLHTMSMAGTRRINEADSFEVKEEEEQKLVTDYIVDRLHTDPNISGIEVHEREKLNAGQVVHFVNRITASYSPEFDVEEFLYNYHPTPAVGGSPKDEALQYIAEYENHDRSYYGGYFGLRSNSEFRYFVNLRCMQVFQGSVVLYAGGGITSKSDPLSEWEETEAKMRTILDIITIED